MKFKLRQWQPHLYSPLNTIHTSVPSDMDSKSRNLTSKVKSADILQTLAVSVPSNCVYGRDGVSLMLPVSRDNRTLTRRFSDSTTLRLS